MFQDHGCAAGFPVDRELEKPGFTFGRGAAFADDPRDRREVAAESLREIGGTGGGDVVEAGHGGGRGGGGT
ncbi:MAG: hypothetical protein KBA51_08765 [Kiritimatiellae bacterium]|nr:hypothetical protein [Kiritimatiellia bacterium]